MSSFKPTMHRGVGLVPALRWHASAAPLRGRSTQAPAPMQIVRTFLVFACVVISACAVRKDPMPELLSTVIRTEPAGLCENGSLPEERRTEISLALSRIDRPGLADPLENSPALYAVIADDPPELKRLLDLGYSTSDGKGGTLLHAAGHWNSVDTARYLLDQGIDPSIPNDGGDTPLAVAVSHGGSDVIRLLMTRGARADSKALDYALICKDQNLVNALVQAGAEVDDKTRALAGKHDMQIPTGDR